jgi:hypothetical protein
MVKQAEIDIESLKQKTSDKNCLMPYIDNAGKTTCVLDVGTKLKSLQNQIQWYSLYRSIYTVWNQKNQEDQESQEARNRLDVSSIF